MLLYDWSVSPIRSGLIRRTDGLIACTSDQVQSDKTDGWIYCMYICSFVLSAGERFEVAQVYSGTSSEMLMADQAKTFSAGWPSHRKKTQQAIRSFLRLPQGWMDSIAGDSTPKQQWLTGVQRLAH